LQHNEKHASRSIFERLKKAKGRLMREWWIVWMSRVQGMEHEVYTVLSEPKEIDGNWERELIHVLEAAPAIALLRESRQTLLELQGHIVPGTRQEERVRELLKRLAEVCGG
jgi:nucleoside-diphosphate-sugar epimerase